MILVVVVAAAVTCISTAAVRPSLVKLRVMDLPSARSSHSVAVARGGGVACMVGALFGVIAGSPGALVLLVVPLMLGAVGLVDDIHSLPAVARLLVQVAGACAAVVVVATEGDVRLAVGAIGVVLFVSFVNAFNFMDGINGISGFNVLVAGVWFWSVGAADNAEHIAALGAVLSGVALGFLPWNAPTARLFLGDSGSYFLGALVALTAWLVAIDGTAQEALAPLVICLADTGWTLVKRAREDVRQIMKPHREHVYQQLADLWGHLPAAAYAAGASAIVCLVVWWLESVVVLVPVAGIVAIYLSTPTLVRRAAV